MRSPYLYDESLNTSETASQFMGPTWAHLGPVGPDGPHIGPMNLAIRDRYLETPPGGMLNRPTSQIYCRASQLKYREFPAGKNGLGTACIFHILLGLRNFVSYC